MKNDKPDKFAIICKSCKKQNCRVLNTIDSDPEDGICGSVTLECPDCKEQEEIARP